MSLTALHWRKLPTRTITASFSVNNMLNNIYDMLTGSLYHDGSARVPGSASAWQNVGRFITGSGTGSNTEAVYCYPPTQTTFSQSFVIAGRNSTGAATTVANATASNNSVIGRDSLGVACVKNAGAFSSWTTGSNGFGAGSVSSGYATFITASATTGVNKVYIYESEEAIAVFMNANGGTDNSAGTFGAIVGALIDPEQTTTANDAESDNRLYGVACTNSVNNGTSNGSSVGMGGRFLSYRDSGVNGANVTSGFLEHVAGSTDQSRFVIFTPQSSNLTSVTAIKVQSFATAAFTTLSGKFAKCSINVGTTGNIFVGRLREISMIRKFQNNLVIRDASNNIVGFTISNYESGQYDALLLDY